MSYTSCLIGGVDMWVDPDNVSRNVQSYTQVEPALDGTKFVHYLQSNPYNPALMDEINVSGMYISEAQISTLTGFVAANTPVKVTGVPGIPEDQDYVILSLSHNPIKPAVSFPGEDLHTPPVRFTYNLRLVNITA